jgi:hypothetical protein
MERSPLDARITASRAHSRAEHLEGTNVSFPPRDDGNLQTGSRVFASCSRVDAFGVRGNGRNSRRGYDSPGDAPASRFW